MATIKDVARKANVSISTASYALNNIPNVHKDTKKRVIEAARELNYTPNATARNLKRKKTGNVGVFIYGFAGPIFGNVLDGILHILQSNNLNIIVSSGKSSSVLLRERQVDAAIIFDNKLSDDLIINYANLGYPVIVLDRKLRGRNIYSSVINNYQLVFNLINEMVINGYKDFAYLSGPQDSFNNQERYKGYTDALEFNRLTSKNYYQGDFTIKSGFNVGKEIANEKEKPQFIYCANDELAIGLIQCFNEANISVPDDIAVAGFDDILLSKYVLPLLTTITIDYELWGENVAKMVVDLLAKKEITQVYQPVGEIKFRKSTKKGII